MQQNQDKVGGLFSWGLIGLLAMAPLVHGGQQPWAALTVSLGVLGLLGVGLLRTLWKGSPIVVWSRQDVVFVVGVLWVLVGLTGPFSPPDALDAFLILFGCVGCFFLARTLAFGGWALHVALRLCTIGGLVALVGLLQVFGVLRHGWWDPPQFVAATFVNHNHFAGYLELLLPVGLALWLAAPLSPRQRFLVAVCSALMLIGFIMSCSRGAWLSLTLCAAVGLGWFGLLRRRRIWSWRRSLGMALAAAAIGFLVSQPPIVARGLSVLDAPNVASFQTRQAIWRSTWELAKAHPLVGQGVDSFQFAVVPYRPAGLFRPVPYAFNEYLQLVAELGLVGLAIAAWIAVLVVIRIGGLVRFSQTPWKRALGFGGLVGLGSVLVHSGVDYPWHIPAVAFTLAAVAGLLAGIRYHAAPVPLRKVQVSFATSRARWARRFATGILVGGLVAAAGPLGQLVVADGLVYRGGLERESGRLEDAVASYREAIRRAPRRMTSHRELGESLVQLAWRQPVRERRAYIQQATEAYRKALGLVPNDAWSAHALGEALKAMADFEDADRWLKQAVTLDPHSPFYWKHWAELKLLRGQGSEAAEAFRRAAALAKPHDFFPSVFEPLDDPNYFVQVGESALLLGRLTLAKTAFTIAATFDPTHPGAQVGLALCALHQGNDEAAQEVVASVHDPVSRAKWFAGLAQHAVTRGHTAEARAAVNASLALDADNVLARHLELVLAQRDQDHGRSVEAMNQLLALNRRPVFLRATERTEPPAVVWEPEEGAYGHGEKIPEGWALSNGGSIRQALAVPPGRVRFRVVARGKTANGLASTMSVSWSGRLLLTTPVARDAWTAYEIEAEVKPGESVLTVDLADDLSNPLAGVYRNLKLEKVVASWGPL